MRTTSPIAGLFGRSPITPIQEHMRVVEECALQVRPLFEALAVLDRDRILAVKDRIFELEQQADDIKNEVRSHLPKSLMLPVDRRDILDLLHAQDSIADTAQDVAGLLAMRRMTIPEAFGGRLMPFVDCNIEIAKQCRVVINELDELLATSFRGRSVDRVVTLIDELSAIENQSDDEGMALASTLFEHEDEMKPLAVMFWYEMLQELGDIADYSEDVGDRLRLLAPRRFVTSTSALLAGEALHYRPLLIEDFHIFIPRGPQSGYGIRCCFHHAGRDLRPLHDLRRGRQRRRQRHGDVGRIGCAR